MRYYLLMIAVVMGQSVLPADKKPLIADPIVDKLMRLQNRLKTEGELSKADLEKVTRIVFGGYKATDGSLKGLAKLQKLESLVLYYTKITADGVTELKKALPKCKIYYIAKK